MKDDENLRWEMKDIAHQYKYENPDWTWRKCWGKAKLIHKELNRLNGKIARENGRFFKMNTPFSFYYNRDDEFANKYVSGGSQ